MPLLLRNSSSYQKAIGMLSRELRGDKEALLQLLLSACRKKTLNRIINCPTYPVGTITSDLDRRLRLLSEGIASDPYGVSNFFAILHESAVDYNHRKKLGQYFTPSKVAEEAIDLLRLKSGDAILDPGCGTGIFALAALKFLAVTREIVDVRYLGIESDPMLALSTSIALDWIEAPQTWRVLFSNYLLVERRRESEKATENRVYLEEIGFPRIDAIIANPPYVRFHRLGKRNDLAAELGISMFSGLHSYFLSHSSRLIDNGRMVFILPLEMDETNHGSGVLERLSRRFETAKKSICFDRSSCNWSIIGQREVSLRIDPRKHHTVAFTLFQFIPRSGSLEPQLKRGRKEGRATTRLAYIAFVHRGISTGANEFFVLTDKSAEQMKMLPKECEKYLKKVIPTKIQLPAVFTEDCWDKYRKEGKPCWLLNLPANEPMNRLPYAIRKYIMMGERKGIPSIPTCKNRKRWYHVNVSSPPDLIFTYISHGCPRFIYNKAKVLNLTNLLGIYWKMLNCTLGDKTALIAELLNHDLTRWIESESVGRKYAGGLIKFEPGDLAEMPISNHTLDELSPGLRRFSSD